MTHISLKYMSKIKSISLLILILAFLSACSTSKNIKTNESKPYSPASKELFDSIAHMDSVMFDAFNMHDLDKLKSTFSEDLEFYHDKGGLAGYKQSMENFKSFNRCCASLGSANSSIDV